jgi:hypothetical protein
VTVPPNQPGQALGRPVRASAPVPAPAALPPAPLVERTETTGEVIAGAAAVAAVAPAPPAAPPIVATPAPPAGPPTTGPDPFPSGEETVQRWRARRHRRLPRLRIGRHTAPAAALDQLQLRVGSVGLLLGHGRAGEPVTLRLFQARPTRVVLVAESWAAQLVTSRALRFGARVVVFTPEPAGWIDLGRRATGRTDRVTVLSPGAPVHRTASPDSPVLRVYIADAPGPDLPQWTTCLTVVPPVTVTDLGIRPDRAFLFAGADVLLVQRLSPREVASLMPVLRLPRELQQALPALPDGVLAAVTRAGIQYAWTGPPGIE